MPGECPATAATAANTTDTAAIVEANAIAKIAIAWFVQTLISLASSTEPPAIRSTLFVYSSRLIWFAASANVVDSLAFTRQLKEKFHRCLY